MGDSKKKYRIEGVAPDSTLPYDTAIKKYAETIEETMNRLHGEGYEVLCAANGQEAIEKLRSEQVDLMLLDLGLPVRDGWGTVIWLAQVNPRLPVIIITGRWNQRELARKMGADALMDKPLDVPRLLQTIRDLMNEPMERRAPASESARLQLSICTV